MALNVNFYDVKKYQFKWVRVLSCVERTWVQVLCMPNCVKVLIVLFLGYA